MKKRIPVIDQEQFDLTAIQVMITIIVELSLYQSHLSTWEIYNALASTVEFHSLFSY